MPLFSFTHYSSFTVGNISLRQEWTICSLHRTSQPLLKCFLFGLSWLLQVANKAGTLAGGHLQPGDGILTQRAAEKQTLRVLLGRGRVRHTRLYFLTEIDSLPGSLSVSVRHMKASPLWSPQAGLQWPVQRVLLPLVPGAVQPLLRPV